MCECASTITTCPWLYIMRINMRVVETNSLLNHPATCGSVSGQSPCRLYISVESITQLFVHQCRVNHPAVSTPVSSQSPPPSVHQCRVYRRQQPLFASVALTVTLIQTEATQTKTAMMVDLKRMMNCRLATSPNKAMPRL